MSDTEQQEYGFYSDEHYKQEGIKYAYETNNGREVIVTSTFFSTDETKLRQRIFDRYPYADVRYIGPVKKLKGKIKTPGRTDI